MEAPNAYSLDHEPIGLLAAAELLSRIKDRTLADAMIGGRRISTVFLVFDRSRGQGPPRLYETRVVDAATGAVVWAERYPNPHAALAGHDRAVAWVRFPVGLAPTLAHA